MSVFQVELKKVVDDSYEIEIGYQLENRLIEDLKNGLVGKIKKFAVITDSTVKELCNLITGSRISGKGICFYGRRDQQDQKDERRSRRCHVRGRFPARLLYHRRWWWCGNRFVWISGRNLWQRSAIH